MAAAKSITPRTSAFISDALAIEQQEAREAGALGFMARALVQCSLPHSRVAGTEYVRHNGAFSMSLLAPSAVGLPYGTVPRLVLSWLCTEAIRSKSRELDLGDSLSVFMRDLGMVPTGGRWGSIGRIKSQTVRLFSSTIRFTHQGRSSAEGIGFLLSDRHSLWWDADAKQTPLWANTVKLSEQFFTEILRNPVPVDMRALQLLSKSPMALDQYCWLTHRVSYLRHDTEIPWEALALQFGSGYSRLRDFKASFLAELRKVQTVYPDARIGAGEYGLLLRPSVPHVRRRG